MTEKTFIMIKPDSLPYSAKILQELGRQGTLAKMQWVETVSRETIEKHYAPHQGKGFYQYLVDYFVGKPVVIAILQGEGIVQKVMEISGPTDPPQASPETIRGKYSHDSLEQAMAEGRPVRNVIHRSDSLEEAEREIEVWKEYFE